MLKIGPFAMKRYYFTSVWMMKIRRGGPRRKYWRGQGFDKIAPKEG